MSYIQFFVSFPMVLVIVVVIEYKILHFFAVIQFKVTSHDERAF